MTLNGDMLSMIFKMLGVKDYKLATDTPDAVITIQYTRYGEQQQAVYTLQDLIDAIQGQKSAELPPGVAPEGFTDINDISTPDPSSG